MPPGFWLGRFVALSDRFHLEDNFPSRPSTSNSATGANQPTSSSVAGFDDGTPGESADAERRRVRRIFTMLQSLCVTDEAHASFRVFWTDYSKKHGGPTPMSPGPIGGAAVGFGRGKRGGFTAGSVKDKAREGGKSKEGKEKNVEGAWDKEEKEGNKGFVMSRLRGMRKSFLGGSEET
jgi:hypothetical protein